MLDMKKFQKMSKDLQAGIETMKDDLADVFVEGASGGGAVKVTVNGNQEMVKIEIQKDAVDPDDIEMLQDLVVAATNQAVSKSKEMQQDRINQLARAGRPALGWITGCLPPCAVFLPPSNACCMSSRACPASAAVARNASPCTCSKPNRPITTPSPTPSPASSARS
jgi:nucleoid-associated protein EbfC